VLIHFTLPHPRVGCTSARNWLKLYRGIWRRRDRECGGVILKSSEELSDDSGCEPKGGAGQSPAGPVPISSDPVIAPRIVFARISNFFGSNRKPGGVIYIFLSEYMNGFSAYDSANYKLTELQSDGTTITGRPVTVFPNYHSEAQLITLVWAEKLAFALGGHLTVSGTPPSGLSSVKGVFLDGTHNGPGTDANLSIFPGASVIVDEHN